MGWSWVVLLLGASITLHGARPPVRTYRVDDGLISDDARALHVDSRGYLWAGTSVGISIFDGTEFRSFSARDGLPGGPVNAIAETADGSVWLGTSAGLCLFSPMPDQARCSLVPLGGETAPKVVTALAATGQTLFAGTASGLFRGSATPNGWHFEPVNFGGTAPGYIYSITAGADGAVYAATVSAIAIVRPNGSPRLCTLSGFPAPRSLHVDKQGRLWAGGRQVFGRVEIDESSGRAHVPSPWRVSTWDVYAIVEDQASGFWLATGNGLIHAEPQAGGNPVRLTRYGSGDGFADDGFMDLVRDPSGNLWAASRGLSRISPLALNFNTNDGLTDKVVYIVNQGRTGPVYAVTGGEYLRFSAFDGGRFREFRPRIPRASVRAPNCNQVLVQDASGSWWLAGIDRLYRFPRAESPAELEELNPVASFPARFPFTIYAAANGDVWVSNASGFGADLTHWDKAGNRLRRYTPSNGLPAGMGMVKSISEDQGGAIWFAGFYGQLHRFNGGMFESFPDVLQSRQGLFTRDPQGRLWCSSWGGGIIRIGSNPGGPPSFTRLSERDGLASDFVADVAIDASGALGVATNRGFQQFQPAPSKSRLFSLRDGIPEDWIHDLISDREGRVWAATSRGVTRFGPREATHALGLSPELHLTGIVRGGTALPVPLYGARTVSPIELPPGQNSLRISYGSISLEPGAMIHYEYRLRPDQEWLSTPQRTLDLASLSPGGYAFEVRAISSAFESPSEPVALQIIVTPPVWARWWFIGLTIGTALLAAHTFYRARLHHLLEIERVRTGIATDLHDDVGASLSRIAILSERAKRHVDSPETTMPILDSIASQSRSLMETMSDVVWSIDPARDQTVDLASRIRDYAGGTLEPRDIQWQFDLDPELEELPLSPAIRRNLLLILKEAIHNAERHSGCDQVVISLTRRGRCLTASVRDNGHGFDVAAVAARQRGRGLASMNARALAVGGTFSASAPPGGGTQIAVEIPIPVN